jgi:predicted outer membrane protein
MKKLVMLAVAAVALVGLVGCGPRADLARDRAEPPAAQTSTSDTSAVSGGSAAGAMPVGTTPAAVDSSLSDIEGLLNAVDSEIAAADAPPADAD